MDAPAIQVQGLGKSYRLGTMVGYRTLSDGLRWLVRSAAAQAPREPPRLEALQDVSFDVRVGEAVGLIGRNGAGKSTLLKILSRITEPTQGRAIVRGRLGALLEVGTGFHPELTGRENIFLAGAILGMRRSEIAVRFDEILSFAELERFVDTPVKRYSSGMYMRLAFSVAAHLEPDILLVDEVLAVGDAAFQRKCLGLMSSSAQAGRTVLFVSHNLSAILALTGRCLYLSGGKVAGWGSTQEIVARYQEDIERQLEMPLSERTDRVGNGSLRLLEVRLRDEALRSLGTASSGRDLWLELPYSAEADCRRVHVSVAILGANDARLFHLSSSVSGSDFERVPRRGSFRCQIPRLPLQPGAYALNVYCEVDGKVADWIQHAARLHVTEGNFFGTGRMPPATQGPLLVTHSWELGGP